MDWQRVKEKVTAQVLQQLQAEGLAATPQNVQQLVLQAVGGAASPSPAPAPRPEAAPKAELVPTPPASLPACEVGADFKTDVLVVIAGPICDKVMAVVKSLAASQRLTVVTGGGSARLADVQACAAVHCEGSESTARHLVEGAGAIVVPVISTTTAAKVAGLIGDCLPSAVLVQAAIAGKKAIVARESIAAPAGAAWAIRRKVEEVASALRTLGFTLTDLNGLAGEVKKATGTKVGGTGGYVPAYRTYQPQPVVQAARAARAETAVGAVEGDYDRELARMIDHTLLKPEATAEQITKLCKEALEYHFWSVCVNPGWVPLAAKLLAGSDVKVCTVIGFPLGATSTAAKALETADTIKAGATEVDMVLNIGALKSGQYDVVLADMQAVAEAARGKALTKVILETGLLTDEEKVKACELAIAAGLDYVKTSTGFGPGGATPEDIALMRKTVGPSKGVKASGGIRDYETALAVVKAGASRIGASASINIVKRVKPKAAAGKDKY